MKVVETATLALMIGNQIHKEQYDSAKRCYKGDVEMLNTWEENIGCKIGAVSVPGKKYTKIDVLLPQQSGRYMVVNDTGEIYGIKAYGVIHKGYYFGTLDTIDNYYWGGYRAVKIA